MLNYFSFCSIFFRFPPLFYLYILLFLCFCQPFFVCNELFHTILLYYISCMYHFWYIILSITHFCFFTQNSLFFILTKSYNISPYQLKCVHFHTLTHTYLFFYILIAPKNDVIQLLRKESNSLLVIQYWEYF